MCIHVPCQCFATAFGVARHGPGVCVRHVHLGHLATTSNIMNA